MQLSSIWGPAYFGRGFFDGGSEDDTPEVDLTNPAIQEAIQAAVAAEVAGLKANNAEHKTEKLKMKARLDELETQWQGLKPEAVRSLIKRFENDEEAQLIADGKVDEVVERRVSVMKRDLEGQLAQATSKLSEREANESRLTSRVKHLILERELQRAAVDQKVVSSAFEDMVSAAARVFIMNESGELEAREGDVLLKGKDGVAPLKPSEWLDSMKQARPHWWPPSQGGGTNGGDGGAGRQVNKDDLSKMSAREKLRMGMQANA